MKTTNLITLCVFLATFLVGGIALANDSSAFDSVISDSTLEAPKLTVTINGTKVTLSWSKVTGATGYQVHYAQYPYDNPETIKTIDVGNITSASYDLSPGDAYHIAVKACSIPSRGFSVYCGEYSIIHDVKIPLVSTFKNSLGQVFKLIPAGTFTMGSPADEPGHPGHGVPPIIIDQETQHQVTLTKSFYMQTTEVTQGQWKEVMGSNPSFFSSCGDNCPVEQVSWDDAQSYIAKINLKGEGTYSLPTEAQWEYACRAGSTTAFYNGVITDPDDADPNLDVIGRYVWNSRTLSGHDSEGRPIYDGPRSTWRVGQKKANVWGLYDMSGNVSEWCQDWFGSYPSNAVTDPTGPLSGSSGCRITRGGSVLSYTSYCRSAARWFGYPNQPLKALGFRLVRQP